MIASSRMPIIYDVDFQANVLDVARQNNYTLPSYRKRVILNRMMKDMKTSGYFSLFDTYTFFSLNNTNLGDFSRVDWKKQGNIYTANGGMIYTADGWKGNALDGYLGTNLNAVSVSHFSQNNASRGMTVTSSYGGALDGTQPGFFNRINNSSTNTSRINSSVSAATVVDLSGTGLKAIVRTGSETTFLLNKDATTNIASTSTPITDSEFVLFRNLGTNYGASTLADYFIGSALDYTQLQSHRQNINNALLRMGLSPVA